MAHFHTLCCKVEWELRSLAAEIRERSLRSIVMLFVIVKCRVQQFHWCLCLLFFFSPPRSKGVSSLWYLILRELYCLSITSLMRSQLNTDFRMKFWYSLGLGLFVYEPTKIRSNFRKQPVSKIEVIKDFY